MLVLNENQKCPHSFICPHNQDSQCFGARENRATKFTCNLVENNNIQENGFRNPLDQTGKMKVIMD